MIEFPIEFPDDLAAENECDLAMRGVHAFLHGELPESSADEIRRHLLACEKCMDNFDVETFIGALLRRCYGPTQAPEPLRMRITRLSITTHETGPESV
ncbi:hypothetical protein GCM10009785_06700 [Brooklawnia cerclae]|uniref:Anti-sigma factor (TIGR02949 family) n=1 Tax=Brooklawnia cerclae TaxID=349934 RepID=A0ABX0SGE9_9ACTN|nr:zf-HC2 domain-containing protein [Brooklawnia cerclae]NIH56408.1 anti-sigma factor (TIGR02949 family) [Brooklawnia cerclae]